MYGYYMFEGGSYKHHKLVEVIEDVGGYIITKRVFAQEAQITFAAPVEDFPRIERCIKEIQGLVKEAPLIGTEIAIISPTVTRHHLPHPLCDVAEFLRRRGAQTCIIGLARGVGRRIAQLNKREKALIEEYDAAVLCLGNFVECIKEKIKIFSDISTPIVVTGLPDMGDTIEGRRYISDLGRYPHKFKKFGEIELLREIADAVEEEVKRRREEISIDPPIIPPFVVKNEIENQVEEVRYGLSPATVALRINGVRVKMPFEAYSERIGDVRVAGYELREISMIRKSVVERGDILVDMLPMSLVKSHF
ncbi:MAG: methyl-coenzyme M reductase family protein [Candidatus Methanospirareceae archaeon]